MKRLLLVQLDIDECHNLSRTDLEDAVTCTLGIIEDEEGRQVEPRSVTAIEVPKPVAKKIEG